MESIEGATITPRNHNLTMKQTECHPAFVPLEDLPTTELVSQNYQPSKAELEADLRAKGTFAQAIKALLRPVRIRRVKPRRVR